MKRLIRLVTDAAVVVLTLFGGMVVLYLLVLLMSV